MHLGQRRIPLPHQPVRKHRSSTAEREFLGIPAPASGSGAVFCNRRFGRARYRRHHQPGRDRLRRACQEILPQFMKLPGVRIMAVCDVRSAASPNAGRGRKGQGVSRFRELLEDKDVNTVVVAPTMRIGACSVAFSLQAGKDVYLEKPAGDFIGEGRFAMGAARKYDRVCVQIGTRQARAGNVSEAVEIAGRAARRGTREVKVWDYRQLSSRTASRRTADPAKELDWDFYIGPSPMMHYNQNCYYGYGYDWFKASGTAIKWPGACIISTSFNGRWNQMADSHERSSSTYAFPRQSPMADAFGHCEYGPGPVARMVLSCNIRCGSAAAANSARIPNVSTAPTPSCGSTAAATRLSVNRRDGERLSTDVEVLASDDEYHHAHAGLFGRRRRSTANHEKPIASVRGSGWPDQRGRLMKACLRSGRKIHWDARRHHRRRPCRRPVHRQCGEAWELEVSKPRPLANSIMSLPARFSSSCAMIPGGRLRFPRQRRL